MLVDNYKSHGDLWVGGAIPLWKFSKATLIIKTDGSATAYARGYDLLFGRAYKLFTYSFDVAGVQTGDLSGWGGIQFNPYTSGVRFSAYLLCWK